MVTGSLPQIAFLGAAGFIAGSLNAIAGGGTFFTLPALVAVGLSPVVANATGTVALLPGYIAATVRLRTKLGPMGKLSLGQLGATVLCGGAIGAALLLHTPHALFRFIVPWLVLTATIAFAAGPIVAARMTRRSHRGTVWAILTLFGVSVYGGYFNGGLGILLLAHAATFGDRCILRDQAVKNLLSAVLTAAAVLLYSVGSVVCWPDALSVTAGAIAGGYTGALFSQRISAFHLRVFIVLTGLSLTVLFFLSRRG